ncbi:D-methionine transport system substrate-binding protein [Breznakia blatticola]|uniref:Lipoprotein n=1 Tax=Breznakia blatticola TaxID=1754012 RepID=A0A4R8A8P0_9FIRM|nr:MetQ/NlpA family ABC transporter substrate-binding protein [Breznakia blatticola]TDW24710.1 D-methionine transport system substrate-binding protein [Breznakia blatticola]
MKKIIASLIVGLLVLTGCGGSDDSAGADDKLEKITVAASATPHAEILEEVKEDLKEAGYELEVKVFDDYILPNTVVDDGEIDANFFQHEPYLISFNEDNGTDLVAVANIHIEPLGIYAKDNEKTNSDFSVADVKEGAVITIPNDPSNEYRALLLLQEKGIIKIKDSNNLKSTVVDIVENPKNVEIKEVEAAGIPATLPDVDYAVINGNYALTNKVEDKLIVAETKDSKGALKYANILAVKKGNEDSAKTKALIKALHTEKVKTFIEETFGDLVIPAFD